MNVRDLIVLLETHAQQFGNQCEVLVVDDQGEWGFSVHVEAAFAEDGPGLVIYLDITGDPI